jgi:peroxiredoxin Q/BCP
MAQLRRDYQKFIDRDAEIIAIGPEDQKSFAAWWHSHKMPFVGVGDPGHVIAKLYSQQVKWLRGGRLPALMVVDKNGDVRFQHYANSPGDIPSDDTVLALLDTLQKETSTQPVS